MAGGGGEEDGNIYDDADEMIELESFREGMPTAA